MVCPCEEIPKTYIMGCCMNCCVSDPCANMVIGLLVLIALSLCGLIVVIGSDEKVIRLETLDAAYVR